MRRRPRDQAPADGLELLVAPALGLLDAGRGRRAAGRATRASMRRMIAREPTSFSPPNFIAVGTVGARKRASWCGMCRTFGSSVTSYATPLSAQSCFDCRAWRRRRDHVHARLHGREPIRPRRGGSPVRRSSARRSCRSTSPARTCPPTSRSCRSRRAAPPAGSCSPGTRARRRCTTASCSSSRALTRVRGSVGVWVSHAYVDSPGLARRRAADVGRAEGPRDVRLGGRPRAADRARTARTCMTATFPQPRRTAARSRRCWPPTAPPAAPTAAASSAPGRCGWRRRAST